MELGKPEQEVHLGQFPGQLAGVSLDETAHGYDGLHGTERLEFRRVEDRLDRFPLRGVDESTGIDEDDIGRRKIRSQHGAVAHELTDQPLRVDGRLVTAERDNPQLHPR